MAKKFIIVFALMMTVYAQGQMRLNVCYDDFDIFHRKGLHEIQNTEGIKSKFLQLNSDEAGGIKTIDLFDSSGKSRKPFF